MARPLRIQYPGAYYHVTCRGNEGKRIFLDAHDLEAFQERLSLSLNIYNVSLLAYICMPNHFHLLLVTPDGNLSEFMRHFNISYTSAFNRRYHRAGHLYQGRYKSFLIDADNYLLEVSRHIHLNPIRTKAFSNKPAKAKWGALLRHKTSSLRGYLSVGKRRDFVSHKTILDYIGGDNRKGRQAYRQFIKNGIEQELDNPLELGKGDGIVGESDFVQSIRKEFLGQNTPGMQQPVLGESINPEELIDNFANLIGKGRDDICQRGKKSLERTMLMELLYRFCRITQPEIGRLLGGIDYSAVSKARKRLQIKLGQEPNLSRKFDKIRDQLLFSCNKSTLLRFNP